MLDKLPSMYVNNARSAAADQFALTGLEMTKRYQRFHLYQPSNNGFVVGLADFACLGWKFYDLSGYPYDDEQAALFSDWVTLGEDAEVAREKFEETVGRRSNAT